MTRLQATGFFPLLAAAGAVADEPNHSTISAPVVVTLVIGLLLILVLASLLMIIQRREIQKSLEQSERRLDLALQVSRDGFWDWNLLTDECYFSPRWREILKLDAEQAAPHISTWESRLHPEDRGRVRERMQAHLDGNTEFYESEHRLLGGDDIYRWHLVRGKLVERTEDGRPARMIGVEIDVTDRRETERLLREKESQLEAIFEYSPAEIYLKDAEGRYVRISREFERRFGVRNEDLVGKLPESAHYEALAESSRAQDLEVLGTGRPTLTEQQATFASDGEEHTLLTLKFPTFDTQGKVTGIGAVVTDISEQKRAEAERLETVSLLRSLTENMPVGLNFKNLEGRYQLVNRAFLEKMAVSEAEILGQTAGDRFSRPTYDLIRARECEVLDSGRSSIHKESIQYPDGRERVEVVTRFPIRDSDGSIQGVGVIDVDITERERAEYFLRDSEQRMRIIADGMPGMLASVDASRRLIFVNREAETWLGLKSDDLIGRHLRDVLGDDAYEAALPYIDRALAGETVSFDLERDYRFGTKRWVAGTLAPNVDDKGNVRGYFALLADVSDLRQAQDKARRAQDMLLAQRQNEKESVQRELDGVRDELVRQTRFAAIGQVAASVAHDLRNPLGAIRNAAYYLRNKRSVEEPAWSEYLDIIDKEVSASNEIIKDLIDMTRVRQPEKAVLNLSDVVNASVRRLRSGTGVNTVIRCEPEQFSIHADVDQIGRVFDNLFLNAVQAMGGHGNVYVSGESSDERDTIRVRDNGPGVPSQLRERAFEPLVTDKPKGTGLGLAICRQIVERHGGVIELSRNDISGAEFVISLPGKRLDKSATVSSNHKSSL